MITNTNPVIQQCRENLQAANQFFYYQLVPTKQFSDAEKALDEAGSIALVRGEQSLADARTKALRIFQKELKIHREDSLADTIQEKAGQAEASSGISLYFVNAAKDEKEIHLIDSSFAVLRKEVVAGRDEESRIFSLLNLSFKEDLG